MRTRHVWLIPPLGVGLARQGFVLDWRRRQQERAALPLWEARVLYVDDRTGTVLVEWIASVYLVPALTERPRDRES